MAEPNRTSKSKQTEPIHAMFKFIRQRSVADADEDLLAQYKATGSMAHLGALYDRYLEQVYGVALRYLQNEALAEDAVMAIFEELVSKARQHEVQQFRPWLYVMAKNHCLMQLRRDSKKNTLTLDAESVHLPAPAHPMDAEVEAEATSAALRDCMAKLSAQQRQCVEWFYYEGRSYNEIGSLCGEAAGKVRSHIQNGRRNLRICMGQLTAKG